MKFSIGDIVLLKQTGEEGRVTGFLGQDMIEVEVAQTHFPVFIDEVEHPYLKWFTEKKKSQSSATPSKEMLPTEPQVRKADYEVAGGFHFSFFPVYRFDEFEDIVDKLKVYFINQMPYQINLQYECSLPSGTIFTHKTELQPFTHFYLHDIPFEKMHQQPRFSWILMQNSTAERKNCFSETLRIKPRKLFDYISTAQKMNNPMFHIKLADDFPLAYFNEDKHIENVDLGQLKKELLKKERKLNAGKTGSFANAPFLNEIDLHIEQLVNNTAGLSNFEMLSIQLEAFERALYSAIERQQLSLIVIHGVGKGRLKQEIHEILKSVQEVEFFQQDWNPKYGYGATEIFFRQ